MQALLLGRLPLKMRDGLRMVFRMRHHHAPRFGNLRLAKEPANADRARAMRQRLNNPIRCGSTAIDTVHDRLLLHAQRSRLRHEQA